MLLAAESIDARFDSDFLTVEVIGTGRQTQAASNFVDVVEKFVDQGTKPRTRLTLLRCLLVRCLLVDHQALQRRHGTIEPRIMVNEK